MAKRLTRHGLTVSGVMAAAVLLEQAAAAGQPASLLSGTIKAVTSVAARQAASAGVVSASVAALTEGVVKTMLLSKLKIAAAMILVLTVSAAGGLIYTTRAEGPKADTPRVEQKNDDAVRAAAIKAVEQFGKSEQASDREAAIQALLKYRQEVIRRTEEAKKEEEWRKRHVAHAAQEIAERFKYRVPIEIGASEFHEGGRLEILEVWGTRRQMEVGGQYLVRGKYKLPPGQRGRIYFYATAGGVWGQLTTTLDLQFIAVDKQEGEFTLLHGMSGEGNFHLVLSDPERYSRMFANVYFGTGDNVLRKKNW